MRIAVNTRLLLKGKLEGIGWFTYENLKRITQNHPEHQFYFLFDRSFSDEFIFSENITPVVLFPQARHPFLWYAWFEFSVTRFLRKNNIDLFLSPDGYLSLRTKIPQIAVIHDINFFHQPKDLPFLTSKYLNRYFPKFAQKACRVVTVSNFSRDDIINSYNIGFDKIDVVYNGVNEIFKPLLQDEIDRVRQEISDGKPYFIFVGAFNPRKNVGRLIEAYSQFRQNTKASIKLVLVGERMFKTQEIERVFEASHFKDDIIFIGRKGAESLSRIVGAAFAMIFPSTFEGFGIPMVEAMMCDVPLAVSNTTSMPEVAGSAAIYFDPFNINSIINAMETLWSDFDLRKELVMNARLQRNKFSWDKSAEELYSHMLKCVVDN